MNFNERATYRTMNPKKVFWLSIEKRNVELLDMAIQRKYSALECNDQGEPPLVALLRYAGEIDGFKESSPLTHVFQALLSHGADPNQTDALGRSALSYLVSLDKIPALPLLPRSMAGKDLHILVGEKPKSKARFEVWETCGEMQEGFWVFSTMLGYLRSWTRRSQKNTLNWSAPMVMWAIDSDGKKSPSIHNESSDVLRAFALFKHQTELSAEAIQAFTTHSSLDLQHPTTGNSLLISAVERWDKPTIEKLLSLNINPKLENKEGETALMIAQKRGRDALIPILERYEWEWVLPQATHTKTISRI